MGVSLSFERRSLVTFLEVLKAGSWSRVRGSRQERMRALLAGGAVGYNFCGMFHSAGPDVGGTTPEWTQSPGRFSAAIAFFRTFT